MYRKLKDGMCCVYGCDIISDCNISKFINVDGNYIDISGDANFESMRKYAITRPLGDIMHKAIIRFRGVNYYDNGDICNELKPPNYNLTRTLEPINRDGCAEITLDINIREVVEAVLSGYTIYIRNIVKMVEGDDIYSFKVFLRAFAYLNLLIVEDNLTFEEALVYIRKPRGFVTPTSSKQIYLEHTSLATRADSDLVLRAYGISGYATPSCNTILNLTYWIFDTRKGLIGLSQFGLAAFGPQAADLSRISLFADRALFNSTNKIWATTDYVYTEIDDEYADGDEVYLRYGYRYRMICMDGNDMYTEYRGLLSYELAELASRTVKMS